MEKTVFIIVVISFLLKVFNKHNYIIDYVNYIVFLTI